MHEYRQKVMIQFNNRVSETVRMAGTVVLKGDGPYCHELDKNFGLIKTHSYPLKKILAEKPGDWVRVNNRMAISRDAIKGYTNGFKDHVLVVLENNSAVKISRRKVSNVLKQLDEWKLLNCLRP
jgi:hypothetical protein